MLELEIFAKPHFLFIFFTPKMCLEKHYEGFDSIYQKQEESGYLVYFAQATKYWFSMESRMRMTGKMHKEREKIQQGLLNYPEVQLSVTSRQLSSVLPTKVFLCGSSKGAGEDLPGGGPGPWVLTDDPWEVIKISKPRRPLNQTKNTSAVKGTVVHSGRLQ